MKLDERTLLIESQYAGSIHYYARLLHHRKVLIEQYEHFQKATYRNRCYIAMPNGKLRLSIPLEKGRQQRRNMRDMKISYDWDWQKLHWNSLTSAYRSSPYFEFYEDDLSPFFLEKKTTYLMDFNEALRHFIIDAINVGREIKLERTSRFEKQYLPLKVLDFRSAILPSKSKSRKDAAFEVPIYHQVFENKINFLPNLSIFDLLFAEGPKSLVILEGCMVEAENREEGLERKD